MYDEISLEDIQAAVDMYDSVVTGSAYWQRAAKEASRIGTALTDREFDLVFGAYAVSAATIEQCVRSYARKRQTKVPNETI